MGALNLLTDQSKPEVKPTPVRPSSPKQQVRSPRKQATPVFRKEMEPGKQRRTTYSFLPPKIESQLLESRFVAKSRGHLVFVLSK